MVEEDDTPPLMIVITLLQYLKLTGNLMPNVILESSSFVPYSEQVKSIGRATMAALNKFQLNDLFSCLRLSHPGF